MISIPAKLEATMKLGEKGQITIPKRLRDRFGLQKDSELEVVEGEGGILVRKRTRGVHPVDRVYGIAKLRGANSVDELIEEMRGR